MENLLKNPGFEDPLTDKEGKVILSTTVKGFRTVGPSSAANWLVWNNLQPQPNESFEPTTTTELIDSDSTLAGGGKKMIHVTTDGERCGIEQVFLPLNTGPVLTFSSAWVYVKSGKVGLGTGNGGNTGLDTFSTKTNTWELLQFPNRNMKLKSIVTLAVASIVTVTTVIAPASASTFPVGKHPSAIAVADFNRDGKSDLAATNVIDNTVSVLLGDGSGGVSSTTNLTVGLSPNSVVAADFNRDGNPDLAVTNNDDHDNTVSVLLGNGSGSFGTQTKFAVGRNPQSIITADFNDDGNPDLATAYGASRGSSVLLGDGSGGFTLAKESPDSWEFKPFLIATADFNGDGKSDLVEPNLYRVLLKSGDGSGGFGSVNYFELEISPDLIAIGDFNRDGNLDLVTAGGDPEFRSNFDGDVFVLLGDGKGSFAVATHFTAGSPTSAIAVEDFNQDGNPDLAKANYLDDNVLIMLGDGNGNFSLATKLPAGSRPNSITAVDFNSNGISDLAVTNFNDNSVSVLLDPSTTVNLHADAINAPPVVTVPKGPLTAPTFGPMYIQGIDVNDPDSSSNKIEVTLSVSNGTLNVKPNVSGGVRSIDITGDSVVGQVTGKVIILKASLQEIRNTLTAYRTVTYQRKPGLKGQDTLIVNADDRSLTGTGSSNTDTKSVIINLK